MTKFEWDETKNLANQAKHRISFEEASLIFNGPVFSLEDTHHSEVRERSYGLLGGTVVLCVIHTDRNGVIRIISARKATKGERKNFDVYLKKASN
tara:strand:- start:3682 stop:3966 length:285 start_codon:yes stop_codon:yes gene_type:complete